MEWYCQYCNSEIGKQCPFRDKQLSDGAVLVTNGGKAGAWYFDDDIDTRPSTTFFWKDVQAYACNATNEADCPAANGVGVSKEEFARRQKEYLDYCKQKDAEDMQRIKEECAKGTITHAGVTYQYSQELLYAMVNSTEEEYLELLSKSKIISKEQTS